MSEVELEAPRDDEVLVRMVATGLCHTDITMGSFLPAEMFPNVFGHEGAGVVEEVGAGVRGLEVGDHVVMSFRSCRDCAKCQAGLVGYCDQTLLLNYMGMRMDGSSRISRDGAPLFGNFFGQSSLAAHALAYADNCVKVDPGARPDACWRRTAAASRPAPARCSTSSSPATDDSLVVYGVGRGRAGGDRRRRRRGRRVDHRGRPAEPRGARSPRGSAPPRSTPRRWRTCVARVKELTGGGATYAIDTTAIPEVVKQAQQSLAPAAPWSRSGLGAEEYALDAIDLLQGGKTVISSIEGDSDPQEMVPRLLGMRAAGTFPMDDLVTTYPADQVNQAVADVTSGAVVKPVLVW